MKFIFEDNKKDILSQFFISINRNIESCCIFAGGNSYEPEIALQILRTSDEHVVCFLDTVPGNSCIIKIYNNLKLLSRQNNYRIIVLPIVCMEYYVIKAFVNSQVLQNREGVDICVNKGQYLDSPVIKTELTKKYCKNFEKYCKFILMSNFRDCAKTTGKFAEDKYGIFYFNDCLCHKSSYQCVPEALISKHRNFSQVFPLDFTAFSSNDSIDTTALWQLHRTLVSEFNNMVDFYKATDTRQTVKYNHIRTIF